MLSACQSISSRNSPPAVVIGLVGAALVGMLAEKGIAGERPVDLELVLSVDVSASMEASEQRLQRSGYVAAFQSPAVIAAIGAGRFGRIAVAFVEWADPDYQRVVIPWTLVDGPESAKLLADRLLATPIGRGFRTSMAQALTFSAALFRGNGFEGTRLAIDLSGDGPNNVTPQLPPARARTLAEGITINGLPIMIRVGTPTGLYSIAGLDRYYRDCVIGGPGAFMIVVKRRAEFAKAIEKKLLQEIMSGSAGGIVPIGDARPIDCTSP